MVATVAALALILTIHVQRRLAARQLPMDWIERTVRQPDWPSPDPKRPGLTRSYRAIPEAGGRVLRVVHRPLGPDILVVTVFLDRGARR